MVDPVYSRLFAKSGYSVALLARGADSVNALAKEITESGGEVFNPLSRYSWILRVVGCPISIKKLFARRYFFDVVQDSRAISQAALLYSCSRFQCCVSGLEGIP